MSLLGGSQSASADTPICDSSVKQKGYCIDPITRQERKAGRIKIRINPAFGMQLFRGEDGRLVRPPPPQNEDDVWCPPIPDGGSRLITPGVPHGGALGANYKLSATTDVATGKRLYEAAVNIEFRPQNGEPPEVVAQMRARFNMCFKAIGPIRGPLLPGQKVQDELTVRLIDPSEAAPLPQARGVMVATKPMWREDSGDWSLETTCSTIVHETMHLLGLVDLYGEDELGVKQDASGHWVQVDSVKDEPAGTAFLAWDCRATADKGSCMTPEVHEDVIGKTTPVWEKLSCECADNDARSDRACLRTIQWIMSPPASCPSGLEQSLQKTEFSDFQLATDPRKKSEFDDTYGSYLAGKATPPNEFFYRRYQVVRKGGPVLDSFLYPAEWKAITRPGCQKENTSYYRCTLNAYATSVAHHGQGCVVNPDECKGTDWLMR
jgi:hypothetical protein